MGGGNEHRFTRIKNQKISDRFVMVSFPVVAVVVVVVVVVVVCCQFSPLFCWPIEMKHSK